MKLVYNWTGKGAGKTAQALGIALRAAAHKKKVIIVQFMKGRKNTGEYKIMQKLKPYYEIHQFGKVHFVRKPNKLDYERAQQGLKFCYKAIKKKPFLLILDEINYACHFGLLDPKEVVKFIKSVKENINIYLTGRNAPKELIHVSDFVVELKQVKRKKVKARKGIEF